ncbi:MAG: tRNA epoxyqueuosine(34) reductase QueG [Anaerolineae bacterium]|nr:tRNA epoxyqueuosine(34) reductase QueG [Anaerolineae bacterium]
MSLTEAIKKEARRLGFDLVGVTTPTAAATYPAYEGWIEAGYHGEMGYLATERARERRADPRKILPECQSILVLGLRYANPAVTQPESNVPEGRAAAYAWGADYHDVIPERLDALVAFIEGQVGHAVAHRGYTDTGPILEHDLAQRAGLGWIGKHSLLINPQAGSYFLLAEVLLGLELEADAPFAADQCGTCTRCIQACPTDCILPQRTIDARRCISYLTIELKGPIPAELRPQTGDWIFGCDICQQVCPWNIRFAAPQGDPALAARAGVPVVDLIAELALTAEEFNRKFKGSPVKRAKRRGYLRNIAVALGNAGDTAAVPALSKALLEDGEALVRGHAAWALGRLGTAAARQALRQALEQEQDAWVREEIEAALGDLEDL